MCIFTTMLYVYLGLVCNELTCKPMERYAFSIICRSRKGGGDGETWEHLSHDLDTRRHGVEVGGWCTTTCSGTINKVENSRSLEHLESCLGMECMRIIISLYIHLAFTWCHKCSQAFPIFGHFSASMYYAEHKPKSKKWGRPGNKAPSWTLCRILATENHRQG